jgi:transposase InsO family protein
LSGKTNRYRLNRGGNRQANAALYHVVIIRMRSHQPTLDDVRRRTAEGERGRSSGALNASWHERYSATCAVNQDCLWPLKTELVYLTRFRTRREAKAALFEYIEIFYNRYGRHSTIGYRMPARAHAEMLMKAAA